MAASRPPELTTRIVRPDSSPVFAAGTKLSRETSLANLLLPVSDVLGS